MVLRDLGVISSLYGLKASCTVIVVGCGLQDAFSMGTAEVQTGTRVVLLQSNLFALCSNYGKWRPIFPKAPMMTTLPNLSSHPNLLCLLVCQLFAFFRHLRPTPHMSQGPWLRKLWEPKSKCLKAVPTHLQKYVVWSQAIKCSVKSYVTGPSTKCYFSIFLFMRVLTHDRIEWTKGCECSECYGLVVLCWVYLLKLSFKKSPSDPWNMIHWMPCRNPCGLYLHLAFTYSVVGPLSVVWSELGPDLPFPLMRVLEVWWSRALSLVCEVGLSYLYSCHIGSA
jgi:hypothetical protein